jgi:hypothetical protein
MLCLVNNNISSGNFITFVRIESMFIAIDAMQIMDLFYKQIVELR